MMELCDLQTGHSFDKDRLSRMNEIVNAIYYLENKDNLSSKEAINIIEHFIQ